MWTARPENRQLPSLPQWLSIRWLTRRQDWTPPQRQMMRKAGRYHLLRGLAVTVVLLLLLGIGWVGHGQVRARALLDNLLRAPTEDVPAVVADMGSYRLWLDEPLRQAYREAETGGDARKQLHASLALLPVDPNQVEYLLARLLAGEPQEIVAIRSGLHSHSATVTPRLWSVLEDAKNAPSQRLRAASALALLAPADARWDAVSGLVVEGLLAEHALVVGRWAEALRPVGKALLAPLSAALLQEERAGLDRGSLGRIYQGYAEEVPAGFALLDQVLAEEPADLRRQANAAVALAAAGRWEKVLPLLRQSPDPTLRSYLIDRLAPGGVEAKALLAQLAEAKEASVKQALLLALGELGSDRLPESQRELLVPRLTQLYEDNDAGVHGAAAWLLRQWGRSPGEPRASATGVRRWYVNSQKQTMVIVPQPKDWFLMGAGDEQHRRRLGRSFAIAAREVTVAQFLAFRKNHEYFKQYALTLDCPVNGLTWYDAAAYCNWLSQKDKLPKDQWCYLEDGTEWKSAPEYLKRTGYRLPTEAEWEFACRAGSMTSWSHGNDAVLLQKYARIYPYSGGKSHPVGSLRPNLLGLFDMHGNALEWCQDWYTSFEKVGKDTLLEDKEQREDKTDKNSSRVLHGGSFGYDAGDARSANRGIYAPGNRFFNFGFRPARTIGIDGPTPLSRQAP